MGKTAIRFRLFALALLVLALAGCKPAPRSGALPPPQAGAPASATAAPEAPAPQAAQPALSAPQQQHLHALIQQVEKAYSLGQSEYRRGNLPEAKVAFDRAVDLMLSSGIDIHATPQLQTEFDRIVDGVNALEMEALKQGNGFVAPEEPTPGEVASDVTFAVDPNIVARAQADLATTKSDLPLVVNDYVASYVNFFANTQKGHNTLLHAFQRSGRYRAMIQRVLAEEGVPQNLIYLAIAESGFQPRALNRRSGAGGMWQFMPYGPYGLTRNAYVDERFDPEKSTRAYARYMKFLYDQLGDWYLAMAAYDHGAGNIQREVQKTGYADFWELYKRRELPAETQNYVPEILAAIIIANHPQQYGFDDITLDPPILTDTVTINYSLNLRLAADLAGVPLDEIEALNPSLLRLVTPPGDAFDLHLPAGAAALFNERIALVPESHRDSWRYHHLAAGDTLDSVAREFHLSPAELASANHLQPDSSLGSLEALVVPVAPSPLSLRRTLLYTVHRGDTLITIADRFGVSLAQLRRWNKLSGIRVRPGSRLRVAEPPVAAHHYRHRRGHKSTAARTAPSTANRHAASSPAHSGKRSPRAAAGSASRKSRARRTKHASKQK